MKNGKYSLSFTVGGLFTNESIELIKLYLNNKNWKQVRSIAVQDNILQHRTISTSKRIISEICSRLELLKDDELDLILNGNQQEKIQILWLAVCLRYKFIKEFAIEVINEKYLSFQRTLSQEDYNAFYNSKSSWNDSLGNITLATQNKLKQVLFKILKEADVIDLNNNINTTIIAPNVLKVLKNRDNENLHIFPVSEQEIYGWSI